MGKSAYGYPWKVKFVIVNNGMENMIFMEVLKIRIRESQMRIFGASNVIYRVMNLSLFPVLYRMLGSRKD